MASLAAAAGDAADEDVARCDRMAVAAALGWAHHACAVSAEDQFANFAHT
jgi:hypothetical protein